MAEYILTAALSFLFGMGGTALINWLRYRRVDASLAAKQQAEAQKVLHDSQTTSLQVNSTTIAFWMETAQKANLEIVELRAQLREDQHALGLCKEALDIEKKKRLGNGRGNH
jgi:hypothetical protein